MNKGKDPSQDNLENDNKEKIKKVELDENFMVLGMCLGAAFGLTIGQILFNDIAIGLSVGTGLGLAIGITIKKKK